MPDVSAALASPRWRSLPTLHLGAADRDLGAADRTARSHRTAQLGPHGGRLARGAVAAAAEVWRELLWKDATSAVLLELQVRAPARARLPRALHEPFHAPSISLHEPSTKPSYDPPRILHEQSMNRPCTLDDAGGGRELELVPAVGS